MSSLRPIALRAGERHRTSIQSIPSIPIHGPSMHIPGVPPELQSLARATIIRMLYQDFRIADSPGGDTIPAFRAWAIAHAAELRRAGPRAITPDDMADLLASDAEILAALDGAAGWSMRSLLDPPRGDTHPWPQAEGDPPRTPFPRLHGLAFAIPEDES